MWEYRGNDTSNDYLEHYKYTRRERVGDKWRYWYDDIKDNAKKVGDKVETTVKRVKGDISKKIEKGKKFVKDAFTERNYAITYHEPDGTRVYKKHTGNQIWGRDYVIRTRATGAKKRSETDEERIRKRAAATRADRQSARRRTTSKKTDRWTRMK